VSLILLFGVAKESVFVGGLLIFEADIWDSEHTLDTLSGTSITQINRQFWEIGIS